MVPFDLVEFIRTISYIGLFALIFSESGLLVGFFLPGDTVLFTAGFLASQGILNLPLLIVVCFLGAILGDSVGYAFGKRIGPRLFNKEDSRFFHKDHLLKAQAFYAKHGGKTIILARFMPVVRTFAPIVAGMGTMEYKKFLMFNIAGGILWAIGLLVAGYFLGSLIPNVDHYLLPIVLLIAVVSMAPGIYHVLKDSDNRSKIKQVVVNTVSRKTY